MRRLPLVIAFVALAAAMLAVSARPARAGCSLGPQIVLSPESGTLPPNPTVFVFLRLHPLYAATMLDELTVTDGTGRPLAFVRTDLPSAGGAPVARLAITATAGTLTVHARAGSQFAVARYSLGARPARASTPATSIVEATYIYASGCPASNGFMLAVSPKAPAYRVAVDGKTWIVPDLGDATSSQRQGTIVTGYVDCFDFTIPTDKPLALSITPLLADGAEGDTRDEACQTNRSCRPIGRGEMICTGGIDCDTGTVWTLHGAVTRRR